MADTNTYVSKQKVEKWTTRDKFNAFDLSTIETGTEYNLTGAIEEGELDSALQTKINGKLTAPTTPTAESAVTMLADGTVGTKLLSEIGGGKLYRHDIKIRFSASNEFYLSVYSINNTAYNITTFFEKYSNIIVTVPLSIDAPSIPVTIEVNNNTISIYGTNDYIEPINIPSGILSFTDTVTEL